MPERRPFPKLPPASYFKRKTKPKPEPLPDEIKGFDRPAPEHAVAWDEDDEDAFEAGVSRLMKSLKSGL